MEDLSDLSRDLKETRDEPCGHPWQEQSRQEIPEVNGPCVGSCLTQSSVRGGQV